MALEITGLAGTVVPSLPKKMAHCHVQPMTLRCKGWQKQRQRELKMAAIVPEPRVGLRYWRLAMTPISTRCHLRTFSLLKDLRAD